MMEQLYTSDYYEIPRVRKVSDQSIVCGVDGCQGQPGKSGTMRDSDSNALMMHGRPLLKPYCAAHEVLLDYTMRGTHPWSKNKLKDGLWCRMPLFFDAMGLDSSRLRCSHTPEVYANELELIQDAINHDSQETAIRMAKAFVAQFTNEHAFGSKDKGDYTFCVCNNCAGYKTSILKDYQKNVDKSKSSMYTRIIMSVSDNYLKDQMKINSWTITEAKQFIEGN